MEAHRLEPARRVDRSRSGLAVVLGALTAFGAVSVDLYLPAFPEVAKHYGTSVNAVQITLATFVAGLALGQSVYGVLSDRHGRRRPLAAGILLYVGASVACAFAPSIEIMAGLRFVQAFGACAGIVIARAIVRDLFAGIEAARFFSLLILVLGGSPILAPIVGGQIVALAGWRGTFVALACFGLLCLAGAAWLPETLPPDRRRPGGLRELPSSYRRLVGSRVYMTYTCTVSLAMAAMFAYITASPAVIIDQHGLSPQAFGFVFGANAIGFVVTAQIAGRLLGRLGSRTLLRIGVAVQAAAALGLLVVTAVGVASLAAILPLLFVVVSCIGVITPSATALALMPFPQIAGAASALLGTIQQLALAIAGALVSVAALRPDLMMGIVVASVACLGATILFVGGRSAASVGSEPVPG